MERLEPLQSIYLSVPSDLYVPSIKTWGVSHINAEARNRTSDFLNYGYLAMEYGNRNHFPFLGKLGWWFLQKMFPWLQKTWDKTQLWSRGKLNFCLSPEKIEVNGIKCAVFAELTLQIWTFIFYSPSLIKLLKLPACGDHFHSIVCALNI